MPDTKLSALAAATDLHKADIFELVDVSVSLNEKATLEQLAQFTQACNVVIVNTARTLTSQTASQPLFAVANDTLTLSTGVYLLQGLLNLTSMSATSGNAQFQIVGAGTATTGLHLTHYVGVDGAITTAANQSGLTSNQNQSPTNALTAGTANAMTLNITGSFEVTNAGTIIPSIALTTAAAAVLNVGSYIRVIRIGATGMNSVGDWS